MTYVEFFDESSVENICSCLTEVPDRVLILGYQSKKVARHIQIANSILCGRGHTSVEFKPYIVQVNNVAHAIEVVEGIVADYDDLVFDITGGDPLLTMALGVVLQRHSDRHFQVHRMVVRNNRVIDCDQDGTTIYRDTPQLTVRENILLYKADVMFGDIDSELTYEWDLSDEFMEDFPKLWRICTASDDHNLSHWNKQMSTLGGLADLFTTQKEQLSYCVALSTLEREFKKNGILFYQNTSILDDLKADGMITSYTADDETFSITFKNPQVKRLLCSAGALLEMKTYLCMKDLKDINGRKLFNSILTGVVIDWDGRRQESKDNETKEEKKRRLFREVDNEVDVMAMHDMVPVFVSCKNGQIKDASELYKLSEVAARFGDEYAKKILIASSRSFHNQTEFAICERARQMGISVIKNVDQLSDEAFAEELKKLF